MIRIGKVNAQSLYHAWGLMPWAKQIIRCDDSYVGFESIDDYIRFIGY
jgi:hypothetical protein